MVQFTSIPIQPSSFEVPFRQALPQTCHLTHIHVLVSYGCLSILVSMLTVEFSNCRYDELKFERRESSGIVW